MKTPFTTEQFFKVFEQYNSAVFPIQIILLVLGIAALLLIHSRKEYRNRLIGGLVGILWLWIGVVYHLSFFTSINKAAYGFGGLFVLQGIFFFVETFRNRLAFSFERTTQAYIGYVFMVFGLIIYPVISFLLADSPWHTISLGLPCPTTIFTFGLLMVTSGRFPRYLLIIPLIWALIGTSAAVNFGVYQDYVMLLAALMASLFLFRRKGHKQGSL